MVANHFEGRELNADLHEARPSLYRPVKVAGYKSSYILVKPLAHSISGRCLILFFFPRIQPTKSFNNQVPIHCWVS